MLCSSPGESCSDTVTAHYLQWVLLWTSLWEKCREEKKEKIKVLQTLINMSHVWKVWLLHTTKKEKLGKKLNNCTSLPFTTIFHLDKHKCFVCYLLGWCKAAMKQNHLFCNFASSSGLCGAAEHCDCTFWGCLRANIHPRADKLPILAFPFTEELWQAGYREPRHSHNFISYKHNISMAQNTLSLFPLTNGKVSSGLSYQVGM